MTAHMMNAAVFRPATQGPITHLTVAFDVSGLSGGGNGCGPSGHVFEVLLRQGAVYFARTVPWQGQPSARFPWRTLWFRNLGATHFGLLTPGTKTVNPAITPDFTASGGPIEIGYLTTLSTGNTCRRVFCVDNFFASVNGPAARVQPYGCGINPPESLSISGGQPTPGATMGFGIDNTQGTQTPTSTTSAFLWASLSPFPNNQYPCGFLMPGWGMFGGAGEFLINPAGALLIGSNRWTGSPAPIVMKIPLVRGITGASLYVQGAIIDLAATGGQRGVTLTEAFRLLIGQ